MSNTSKRKRSDSAAGKVEAVKKALNQPLPPPQITLSNDEMLYWDAIISTRANWTANDLIIAAQLAKVECEISDYLNMVSGYKRLVKKDNSLKVSAVHRVLDDLIATQMSLCRSLQIHARATQGESRDQIKQNNLYHHSQETVNDFSDLIAKPMVQ